MTDIARKAPGSSWELVADAIRFAAEARRQRDVAACRAALRELSEESGKLASESPFPIRGVVERRMDDYLRRG
jgi:hypothetical protein